MAEYIKREDALTLLSCFSETDTLGHTPLQIVEHLPTADVVEVVRCKDCIEYYAGMEKPICTLLGLPTEADFFCAEGRDKEHDQERRTHQAHRQV